MLLTERANNQYFGPETGARHLLLDLFGIHAIQFLNRQDVRLFSLKLRVKAVVGISPSETSRELV